MALDVRSKDVYSRHFQLYKRKITITEQSGNNLTDYQVKISLDSTNFDFSHCKSDGSDIRFYDSNNDELSYWIEKWDSNNQEAIVWVKIPSISGNSSIDIWMYYGNLSVESKSNGEETFDFFDHFEGTDVDINKWEGDIDEVTIENSYLKIINKTQAILTSKNTFDIGLNYVLETYGYDEILNDDGDLHISFTDMSYEVLSCLNWDLYLVVAYEEWGGADFITYKYTQITYSTKPVSGLLSLEKDGNNYIARFRLDETGTLYEAGNLVETLDNFKIAIGISSSSAGTIGYDWIRLRKYEDPEPSVTIGSEEIV